ncbi:MAG: tetratricopeptide repeat protein, partial [Deltaproteobacteria bacterium]|nr:tetratricopeptide repeat protein [Deltaproteobacteria bacterium]
MRFLFFVFITAFAMPLYSQELKAEDYFKLGNDYLNAGQTDKAIESYEKALNLKKDVKEGWYNLGSAYGR